MRDCSNLYMVCCNPLSRSFMLAGSLPLNRFANNGKYRQAIANFEAALTLKHTHKNARKYLVETQVAYGQE